MNGDAQRLRDAFDSGKLDRMSYDYANEQLFSDFPTTEVNVRNQETIAGNLSFLQKIKLPNLPWWAWILLLVGVAVIFKPRFLTRLL